MFWQQVLAKPGTSAYNLALADYCKEPEITLLDTTSYQGQVGDQIKVKAIDNFRVTEVKVSIYDATDVLIESSLAVISTNNIDWIYEATTLNGNLVGTKVTAEAKDTPGHIKAETVII